MRHGPFVAVAEHTGQLGRLTETVLKEGLRRCRQWADASRPLNVAVNLSSRTQAVQNAHGEAGRSRRP
jgi:predicted signal transduction protein with EAL and GGDEF domain